MKKIGLIVICTFFILVSISCNTELVISRINELIVPTTVIIDGVTYRGGFYGDLWPINLTYETGSYKEGVHEFRRVDCEQFDWVHSSMGGRSEGVLYCAENQWEQAHAYYADNSNFLYCCNIGGNYIDRFPDVVFISDIDTTKFDLLMTFADTNAYDPFESNKNVKTHSLPIPDRDESPELIFYKESKDGFFTSYKGNKFRKLDGKLLLVFYYDFGYGEYEEMVVVDVPDELGQYFIELLAQLME